MQILAITEIEVVFGSGPGIPAPPRPEDPSVLDRDQAMVSLIANVTPPNVGESFAAIDDTDLLPAPVRLNGLAGHQVGEDLMPECGIPVRLEKLPRFLRCGLTDPRGDGRPA